MSSAVRQDQTHTIEWSHTDKYKHVIHNLSQKASSDVLTIVTASTVKRSSAATYKTVVKLLTLTFQLTKIMQVVKLSVKKCHKK